MAILSSYHTVWITEFAPKENQTKWLGGIQIGRILGVALGGLLSTVGANSKEFDLDEFIDWKVTFIILAVAFLAIGLAWFRIDNRYLDNQHKEKEAAKLLID